MNILLSIVVHTSNILGIFNDPFEFEGNYGPEINPVRKKVFELVVNNVKNIDPTFSEIATPQLLNELTILQKDLANFSDSDLKNIYQFINHYGDQNVLQFFRNCPQEFLSLDKILRDEASRKGEIFNMPILSSPSPLIGQNKEDIKKEFLKSLFTEKTFSLTKPEADLNQALKKLDSNFLKKLFGEDAKKQDLEIFCTPTGQVFFYWLYHSMNLQLIGEDPRLITEINLVKKQFVQTLGNPEVRAASFLEKLIKANTAVLFTQESDTFVPSMLLKDSRFLPIDKQNPRDGCFIFLRSDLWKPDYEIISLEDYPGYAAGKVTLILATLKEGEKFLLASAHGHSTKAEDGRLQIRKIWEKHHQLSSKYPELQLLIGIDANTKSEEDIKQLRVQLDKLGLTATSVGPTTLKKRMITVQHKKACRLAIDEEDYLITLKPENGGKFLLTHQTVGFSEERVDVSEMLPNINNPSDHYPVGAILEEK